jgi:hypothetical protein
LYFQRLSKIGEPDKIAKNQASVSGVLAKLSFTRYLNRQLAAGADDHTLLVPVLYGADRKAAKHRRAPGVKTHCTCENQTRADYEICLAARVYGIILVPAQREADIAYALPRPW